MIWRYNRTSRGYPGSPTEVEVRRLASDIDGVRERSERAEADQKDAANRAKSAEGSKRSEAESLHDILG